MPKRTDIKSILIIGSGPIVIGQACEFDYSGTQACKILREEGYRIILANSNPATIMTDPDFADATYVEPLTASVLESIIEIEKPDALLPTLGGQTALNLAMEIEQLGILKKHNVEMIGATAVSINTAENRQVFKEAMDEIGLKSARSGTAHTPLEAQAIKEEIGLPMIIRPAYILGGKGTGIANTEEEFKKLVEFGLKASPIGEILVEQSLKGWKEFEMEVMRDNADNCVIICAIENVDAMGVHTGDSITVAPAQTLSDREYQEMRDASFAVLRRVGVETGGSNVQFAVNPENGEQVVIEMNPRVSRSSALASKATGFPIAKIAALLAVGYRLDEIQNDITKQTPASFEPAIDYVVTKVPRWTFEKFPDIPAILGTQMQSVGEVMAIGRTFPESLQKALRSLEQGRLGLNSDEGEAEFKKIETNKLLADVATANPDRIYAVEELIRRGVDLDEISKSCGYDLWFLVQMARISEARKSLKGKGLEDIKKQEMKHLKQLGFADAQLGYILGKPMSKVKEYRQKLDVFPTYKTVDTCAAEFAAETPYFYSTWEDENEAVPSKNKKVIILGSGPNRIGQGIEFDYACVHASFALQEAGYESIMINCNPETVSTDYDTSDRLYFEPLTFEDAQNIIELEKPDGVIVSLGGQTPLKLADQIDSELVLGTSPKSIDLAEDRDEWNKLCKKLRINQPAGGTATNTTDSLKIAKKVGYPVLVRPSYVLGGRAMQIAYNDIDLKNALKEIKADGSLGREGGLSKDRPVLIDHFLESATEVDVDALRDKTGVTHIGGIMQHVEEAGIHSGDSACAIPAEFLSGKVTRKLIEITEKLAKNLEVIGLLNVQFAIKNEEVYVIEANPRASRTVPFVAKAIGVPLIKIATRIMLGESLKNLSKVYKFKIDDHNRIQNVHDSKLVAVKQPVFPFSRFADADSILGPEMRSTGEVMGVSDNFATSFAKALVAGGDDIPHAGTVFLSVANRDKEALLPIARKFIELGFTIAATGGTSKYLKEQFVQVAIEVAKVTADGETHDGTNAANLINSGLIKLVINTPMGRGAKADGDYIRIATRKNNVPIATTIFAAEAIVDSIENADEKFSVRSLQSWHGLNK
ncbi:carbamoyl-phosphate synthase large subunit [Candidatus Saccharibacteria bacterium]|nr:carbamoyl-phosphate synthase large subunit [Candidatus Saccharibacteria bacterium]